MDCIFSASPNYTFSLIDIEGKTIFTKQIENAKIIEQISIASFAKGIYLGVLECGDKRITKKIIIE